MIRSIALFASICVMLLCGPVSAGKGKDQLDSFIHDIKTLRAEFAQTQLDPRGDKVQEVYGTFIMQRPGKFRWDYRQPYEQAIVADGSRLWIYDKDLEQVTVRNLEGAIGNTPALLLSGGMELSDNFVIVEAPDQDGLTWVELTPLDSESNFKRLRLAFENNSVRIMQLYDSFDQTTILEFSQVQTNTTFPADSFRFQPPPGVDVIEEAR